MDQVIGRSVNCSAGAMGVLGHEEYRLLGVLTAAERKTLAELLRRIMLAAERPPSP